VNRSDGLNDLGITQCPYLFDADIEEVVDADSQSKAHGSCLSANLLYIHGAERLEDVDKLGYQ